MLDCLNTICVSNSLDPDQAPHFVGPDLGPAYLQSLSADLAKVLATLNSEPALALYRTLS